MKISNDYFDGTKLTNVRKEIDEYWDIVKHLVRKELNNLTDELDILIREFNGLFSEKNIYEIPTEKLNDIMIRISTELYFIQSRNEGLGIKFDISEALYRQTYYIHYAEKKGTVNDRHGYAEMESLTEKIIKNANERAYKIVKGKIDRAFEIINCIKKVLSGRIVESELGRTSENSPKSKYSEKF